MSLRRTLTLTHNENVHNLQLSRRDIVKIEDALKFIDERTAPSPLLGLIGTGLAIMLQAAKTAMGRTSGPIFEESTFAKVLDVAVFWKSYLELLPFSRSFRELSDDKRMVVFQVTTGMTRAVSAYIEENHIGIERCLRMFGDIGEMLGRVEYRDDKEYFDFLQLLGFHLKRIGEYGL